MSCIGFGSVAGGGMNALESMPGLSKHQTNMANAELYAGVRVLECSLCERFLVGALAPSPFYAVVRIRLWFALC